MQARTRTHVRTHPIGTNNTYCNRYVVAGIHTAVYQALLLGGRDEIVFRKIRQTKVVEHGDHGQIKVNVPRVVRKSEN